MAGNYLTLHTNDRVVVTTSRGNQEKWFDTEKNLWYKVDDGCFEALAEAVSSEVLRNFTNAVQLPGISVANYWVDTAEVHGLKRVVSVSENFKREDESLITANTIWAIHLILIKGISNCTTQLVCLFSLLNHRDSVIA